MTFRQLEKIKFLEKNANFFPITYITELFDAYLKLEPDENSKATLPTHS
jgi:hypothetical protein